jgi:hypothetical protein
MHHLVHPRVWAVEEIASINQFTQKLELLREADIHSEKGGGRRRRRAGRRAAPSASREAEPWERERERGVSSGGGERG